MKSSTTEEEIIKTFKNIINSNKHYSLFFCEQSDELLKSFNQTKFNHSSETNKKHHLMKAKYST